MRKYGILMVMVLGLISCKNEEKKAPETTETELIAKVEYKSFGKEIIADDAIEAKSMVQHYEGMKAGDSIDTKMTAKVDEVCKAKGC